MLWASITKVYGIVQQKRNRLKLRNSRRNYCKHKQAYTLYQKSRKKTKRKEKKLRRQLLKYLLRLLQGLDELQQKYQFNLSHKEQKLLATIHTVYEQQHELLYGNTDKIAHRIT